MRRQPNYSSRVRQTKLSRDAVSRAAVSEHTDGIRRRRLDGWRRRASPSLSAVRAPEPQSHPNGGYLVNVAYLLVTTACLATGQNPGQPPGPPPGDQPKVQPAPVVPAPVPPGGY